MNNLADVCLVRLGVGGNYVRCVSCRCHISETGGAKRCERDLKVIVLKGREWEKGASHKEGTGFYERS